MNKNILYHQIKNLFKKKKIKVPNHILKDTLNEKFNNIQTHKNYTSLIFFPKKNIYRKFSTQKKGKKKIESEYKGIRWYSKRTNRDYKLFIKNYLIKDKYAFIDLKNIDGIKIKSWDRIENNYKSLVKVLKHYIMYSKKTKDKINGDLTFDNIIFSKKKIHIIDWEFFNAKKQPYGYDIIYLFLSAACLPYIAGKRFTKIDKILFKDLWKRLIEKKFNKKIMDNPFHFFKENIKKDSVLRESMKLSKSKFFPFITHKIHIEKILKIIKSASKRK